MSDLVGNPEDRFSHVVAHIPAIKVFNRKNCFIQEVSSGACCIVVDRSEMILLSRRHEKTCLLGFRPDPTQNGLCSNRRWLEA